MNTFALRPLSLFAMPVRKQLPSNTATVKTEPTAFSTMFTKVSNQPSNQPTVKIRDGSSFDPIRFASEALFQPSKEICRQVSEAMKAHGIIAIVLSEHEQKLMQDLQRTTEAIFALEADVLADHHVGGARRTEHPFVLPNGIEVPAGTRLPVAGLVFPTQNLKLKQRPVSNSLGETSLGETYAGTVQKNLILDQTFLARTHQGRRYSIIPPNTHAPELDFETVLTNAPTTLRKFTTAVMKALRQHEGWSSEIFDPLVGEPPIEHHTTNSFRLLNMPPQDPNPLKDLAERLAGHFDRTPFVAAVTQASQPGLQVIVNGEKVFRDVVPPEKPNSVVYVLGGDKLNRFTDGQYEPSIHRVVGNQQQIETARTSQVFFHSPCSTAEWRSFYEPYGYLTIPDENGLQLKLKTGDVLRAYKALPLAEGGDKEAPFTDLTEEWIMSTYPAALNHRFEQFAEHKKALVAKYGKQSS